MIQDPLKDASLVGTMRVCNHGPNDWGLPTPKSVRDTYIMHLPWYYGIAGGGGRYEVTSAILFLQQSVPTTQSRENHQQPLALPKDSCTYC